MAIPFALLPVLLALGPVPYSPQVSSVAPCGGARGTEVVVTLTGQRLLEPQGLLLAREGLVVGRIESVKPETCKVTLVVPPECPLGMHPFRLRTKYGLSNLLAFEVGVLRELAFDPKSDKPCEVPLGTTVSARLAGEETHRYALTLAAGECVHCEVEGLRLGQAPLDLAMVVLGPDGTRVAAADDTALGIKDPLVTFTAAVAGTYRVEIAPAFVAPTNVGEYRMHVGTFPRPIGALPCGGAPGEELDVELLGDVPGQRMRVRLPERSGELFAFLPSDARGTAPTPIWLRVGGPPNQVAKEDAKGRLAVTWPASVHGVLGKPDAVALYAFTAKKGQELEFRVFARTLRSPLDAVLTLRQADGRFVAGNDDNNGPDPLLRFAAPADGDYVLEVRDLLRKGSSEHFYRLEGAPRVVAPSLRMIVSQREEASIAVPRGGCGAAVLAPANFDGEAQLELVAERLPAGVSASFGPLRRGANVLPLVLHADTATPLQGANLGFAVRGPKAPESRPSGYAQEVPRAFARNNQPVLSTRLDVLQVAVTESAPFTLKVDAPRVPVVRGAPLALVVHVERAAGFADPVRLRALWNPPGLSSGQVVLDARTRAATFTIDAAGAAQLGAFPYALIASVDQKGGVLELASEFVEVRVDQPWLEAELGKVRTEQGAPCDLAIKIERKHEFAGAAAAVLLGLPRGVTATPQTLAPDAKTLTFALQVAADAQVGKHRSVVLEVRVPTPEGELVHRFGGGELRVDAPLANAEAKR